MKDCDYSAPWYHGSPERLTALRAGSWVTQLRGLAGAFSHKPSLISLDDDCLAVKHNGRLRGFLYTVAEPVGPADISYLRDTARTHWQTQRDLAIRLVAELPIDDPPLLTDEEVAAMRKHRPEDGTGFIGTPDPD